MARIRSLKPGFFSNEELCELSPWHRLCFAGLWTVADREGRLEDRPRRLKASIFPYDDLDMEQLLEGLADKGFVIRYVADGVAYLAIPTFHQHQRPKTDETPSVIPPPNSEHPRGKLSVPRSYNGQRDLGSGILTGGAGADVAPLAADGVAIRETADGAEHQRRADAFMELWNTHTHSPIARCRDLSSKRRRQIRARLTERPLTEWQSVFERIQASEFCGGQNDRGWVASFDWVIGSPDVALKVLEGKYDNRTAGERRDNPRGSSDRRLLDHEPWFCRHEPRCGNRATCAVVSARKAST